MSPDIDNVTEWLQKLQLDNAMQRLAELPPGDRVNDGTPYYYSSVVNFHRMNVLSERSVNIKN
jgi:hypothetical protein